MRLKRKATLRLADELARPNWGVGDHIHRRKKLRCNVLAATRFLPLTGVISLAAGVVGRLRGKVPKRLLIAPGFLLGFAGAALFFVLVRERHFIVGNDAVVVAA